MIKRVLYFVILITKFAMAAYAGEAKDEKIPTTTKTGYLTSVFARESERDTPRHFFLLIGEKGDITLLGFERYSSKNKSEYSNVNFDPRKSLGKCITMTFSGEYQSNNKEFNIATKGGKVEQVRKSRVVLLSDWKEVDKKISVDKKYLYPVKDTVYMPHDITLEEVKYIPAKKSSETVSLAKFVTGKGTEANPYVSEDGSAGLSEAIKKLKGGGTVLIPEGRFFFTAKNFDIPRGVNLKGAGEDKSTIIFKNTGAMNYLGNNTLEHYTMDITIPQKYGYVTQMADYAQDVLVRNITVVGDYHPDPKAAGVRIRNNSTIPFTMGCWVDGFTIEDCKFHNVYRSFVSKGHKEQRNITVRNCLFDGHAYTCISLDQTSGCENFLIEDCEFRDFSHFGTAFARITDVTIRNCKFFSRTLYASAPYNQAIHLEDHCQNFVIESNDIDIILKGHQDTRPSYRSAGVALGDTRRVVVRNNTLKHCMIVAHAGESPVSGYNLIENNTIEDGMISIADNVYTTIKGNTIINPPTNPFTVMTPTARGEVCDHITITDNSVTGLKNMEALVIKGFVEGVTFTGNKIEGEGAKLVDNGTRIEDAKIIVK